MPLGELPINGFSIPQHAPPYPIDRFQFKLSLLAIEYHTTATAAREILPKNFEIEDEPLCRSSVFNYHMSTVGAYTEYVHQIEVKWKGQKYDYVVALILDNESAIYAGREQWGFPKVQGEVNLQHTDGLFTYDSFGLSAQVTARRPAWVHPRGQAPGTRQYGREQTSSYLAGHLRGEIRSPSRYKGDGLNSYGYLWR